MTTHVQSRVKIDDALKALIGGQPGAGTVVPLAKLPAGSAWQRTYIDGDDIVTEWIEPSEVYVKFSVRNWPASC